MVFDLCSPGRYHPTGAARAERRVGGLPCDRHTACALRSPAGRGRDCSNVSFHLEGSSFGQTQGCPWE